MPCRPGTAITQLKAQTDFWNPTGLLAQDLMALYQLSDTDQARTRATELITNLRSCPIAEITKLGRTLHAWRDELLAHFDHPAVSNGPTENLNLKIKNTKRAARGYRNFSHYRLRLAQPRPHPRRSLTDTDQNQLSQVRCVEPVKAGDGFEHVLIFLYGCAVPAAFLAEHSPGLKTFGRTGPVRHGRQYLLDNAMSWLRDYRLDGLGFDMTAYIRNVDGSNDSPRDIPDGWRVLQEINDEVAAAQPWKILAAEDMQGNDWITQPPPGAGPGSPPNGMLNYIV